jgi:hypothetical protein
MKSTATGGIHEFHPRHDFLRVTTSHLNEEELELQEDMNLAHAKIGTAANIHYVHSVHQGRYTKNPHIIVPDSLAL